jgi:hypothetical protein
LGRPLRRSGNVSALERCVAADRQEIRRKEDWHSIRCSFLRMNLGGRILVFRRSRFREQLLLSTVNLGVANRNDVPELTENR